MEVSTVGNRGWEHFLAQNSKLYDGGVFFIVELIILDGSMLYSICADDLNTTSFNGI